MKRLTLLLIAASFFIEARVANAGFLMATSTNGITWAPVAAAGDETFAQALAVVNVGGLHLTGMNQSSNWTGDVTGTGTLSSTVRVTGVGSAYLAFSISGFTLPTAPPTIVESTSVGGTSSSAFGNISITSFVDQANRLISTATPPPLGDQAGPVGAPFFGGGSVAYSSPTGNFNILALNPNFSIDQVIHITVTANGNLGMQFTGSTLLTPTPEPATAVLFAIGSAVLGFGWKRRKQSLSVGA